MPELTTLQWVLVGILAAIQFGLLVSGLIAVLRTPAERLTAPRLVWVAICFVQLIGPVIFFMVGRKPIPVDQPATDTDQQPIIGRVVAELYGGSPS